MLKGVPETRFDLETVIGSWWVKGDVINQEVEWYRQLIKLNLRNFFLK